MSLTEHTLDRSYSIARKLFMDAHFVTQYNEEGKKRFVAVDRERGEAILSLLADGGNVFIAVWDNASSIWADIRGFDDYGVGNWILQASMNWRAMSFTDEDSYFAYLQHLSQCYGGYHPKPKRDIFVDKNIAVDDDLHNRLPEQSEHYALLYCNPWLAYLLTLHMSFYDLLNEIYESNPGMITKIQRDEQNT